MFLLQPNPNDWVELIAVATSDGAGASQEAPQIWLLSYCLIRLSAHAEVCPKLPDPSYIC
jgi:hypothetical protein